MPLLLLCTLYLSIARRLGLGLRLVSVRADVRAPESRGGRGGWEAAEAIPARGAEAEGGAAAPLFLLQLPGTADQVQPAPAGF